MASVERTTRTRFLILAVAIVLGGCATNPVSGKKEAAFMSEKKELQIGREMDPEVRKQYGVYEDSGLQAYIQQVGEQLASRSHRPELYYRFTVLDSPEVNAFALPGGYVYITRGLLAYLNSEAQLAAVLGHEIGHVTARHAVRQYTTAMATNIGYTIGAIFVPGLADQSVASLFNVMNTALVRGYGRQHELQADQLGAEYLARAGYDPQAMIGVLEVLKSQEEFELERAKLEGREPSVYHGVFATHPSNDQRLQEVVKEAAHLRVPAPKTGRDEYLAHLDGLVFGDSVKQGVRYGHAFYHKDLGIAIVFPENWRIENQPDKIIASSRDNQAKMLVRLQDLNRRISPREFMHERLKIKEPKTEAKLEGTPLEGYTAVTRLAWSFNQGELAHPLETRVTVLYFKDKAYLFYGTAKTGQAFSQNDPLFLDSARGFHALNDAERKIADGLRIQIVEPRPGESFASLSRNSPVPDYPEKTLRLLNNRYPSGEPAAKEKIKIIR